MHKPMFGPQKRKDFPCLFEYRFACIWKIKERASSNEITDNVEINQLVLRAKATWAILATECNFCGDH